MRGFVRSGFFNFRARLSLSGSLAGDAPRLLANLRSLPEIFVARERAAKVQQPLAVFSELYLASGSPLLSRRSAACFFRRNDATLSYGSILIGTTLARQDAKLNCKDRRYPCLDRKQLLDGPVCHHSVGGI